MQKNLVNNVPHGIVYTGEKLETTHITIKKNNSANKYIFI